MGNVKSRKPKLKWTEAEKIKCTDNFFTQSLPNLTSNISGQLSTNTISYYTNVSQNRPWSRISRNRGHDSTLGNRLHLAKTAWPVSHAEALFLPDFKIRSHVTENDFKIISGLKNGAYGQVFHVQRRSTNEEFAMKIILKSKIIAENGIQQVKDEVKIQSMCGHHPFIVNCCYYWQNKRQLFIVCDYMPGGELFDISKKYGQLPEKLSQLYIAEIALALDFLHNAGVIYRDLKLENVLLDKDGHICLTDFGLSKWLKYGSRTSTICGTLQYMAPEILKYTEPYGHAVDWWSFGVLSCVLITGKFPEWIDTVSHKKTSAVFEVNSNNYGTSSISVTTKIVNIPEAECSVAAKDLLNRLLIVNPQKRLHSLSALQNIAYFKDISFADVRSKKISPKEILGTHWNEERINSDLLQINLDGFSSDN